ncbi:MAG: antibiotic biosynthesis monooxygenase [Methanomicrobiales archaeon]|nr:antibiotic biosynthesis monooxygenase [Methanomicrobiales archaeon]
MTDMILVDAHCFIRTERMKDFEKEARKIIPLVNREPGCTRYELHTDILTSEFHFIEEWSARKHLDDHISRPHMKAYFTKTRPWHAAPTKLRIYDISSAQSVAMKD